VCWPLASLPASSHQVGYLRSAVTGRWGDKVMSRVSSIIRHVPAGSTHPDCVFPQLAGSYLSPDELGSPGLAFVKVLIHLLLLDGTLEQEVRLLRRGLLRLVGVDEFSAPAEFVDPCMSFKLQDIICRCVRGEPRRGLVGGRGVQACNKARVGGVSQASVVEPKHSPPHALCAPPHHTQQLVQRLPRAGRVPRPRPAPRQLGLPLLRRAVRHGRHRGAPGGGAAVAHAVVRAAGPQLHQVQAGEWS
jgi:hypothetical protein